MSQSIITKMNELSAKVNGIESEIKSLVDEEVPPETNQPAAAAHGGIAQGAEEEKKDQ